MSNQQMTVTKRDGSRQEVDLNKIVKAISRNTDDLDVDVMRIATKTIAGLYDGATTKELDELSIHTSAFLTAEDPSYGKLAARLLADFIDKEVVNQNIQSFSQSVHLGFEQGLINDRLHHFVSQNSRKINDAIRPSHNRHFDYFGLKTVYDRYLLRHPISRQVIETPQYFFMRVAASLSDNDSQEAILLYNLLSSLDYLPSSPTLFNAGCVREQMSSCFLLDSPQDDIESIYDRYKEVAKLSKFAGGIGVSFSRVRSEGSLIKGTNGQSNGLIPWLKVLDSSVGCVNQGGRRKGAACVYIEPWHADVEKFLECRDNTGDEAVRTHNLNLANFIPDEFMRRVEKDALWSLFDPKDVPHLVDLWGEEFTQAYIQAEQEGLYKSKLPARNLYSRMMRTLAQTGNGWMTFKDRCNETANQTLHPDNMVHLSNLCTEIIEVTSNEEIAVCNLGSINLSHHVIYNDQTKFHEIDFEKLAKTTTQAVRQLDRVIDLNFYPLEKAQNGNVLWRPIGLGLMGLQDVFFKLGLPFDSHEALVLSTKIQEEIYYHALKQSVELAKEKGPCPNFDKTRTSEGVLQFDFWDTKPSSPNRFEQLRGEIKEHGLRNSLLLAIAPTATIASIAGCYECIEPQVTNLFKRETLSGDFLVTNKYLVHELKKLGLWDQNMRDLIKMHEGSIQGISRLPEKIKKVFRTVWELPQKKLIELASHRQAFIDQSQSLNLFLESPNIGMLSSMYMFAWKSGLKTTYYLRSRPATTINKTTVQQLPQHEETSTKTYTSEEALACSLENPEYCEACQ